MDDEASARQRFAFSPAFMPLTVGLAAVAGAVWYTVQEYRIAGALGARIPFFRCQHGSTSKGMPESEADMHARSDAG